MYFATGVIFSAFVAVLAHLGRETPSALGSWYGAIIASWAHAQPIIFCIHLLAAVYRAAVYHARAHLSCRGSRLAS
jgi:hypothetical protein